MELKKVLLVVDNRTPGINDSNDNKTNPTIDFRGSAFKATQIDAGEQRLDNSWQETFMISQLQKRVQVLEEKVKKLQRYPSNEFLKKKRRRKAAEIQRQFQCPNKECSKYYGSQTSLKNHIKIKHGGQI